MKRFSILLAAAALFAAVAGCQKEPAGNEELAKAYAQLTFSFESNSTKASDVDGTDDYDAGAESEYKVKSATLYFVDNTGKVTNISTFNEGFSENIDSNGDVHYTHVVDKLAIGEYKIYITVNHTLSDITVGATEENLQNAIVTSSSLIGSAVPSTGLPMSSRNVAADYNAAAGVAGLYTTATVTAANTKDNPLHINLSIERSVAKISYEVGIVDNTYTIKANKGTGSEIATVTLTHAAVLNQTKDWNAYRRICEYDLSTITPAGFGKIGTTGYIYDPKIINKNQDDAGNTATLLYDGSSEAVSVSTVASTQVLAYAYENAVHKDRQLVGYVTTIRFTGSITPSSGNYYTLDAGGNLVTTNAFTSGTDLYYYDNKFYGSLEALNKGAHLGVSSGTNLNDFNVKYYKNAVCYYDYYIKHFDNGVNPGMGAMEYAIVRNNSYVVKVTGVVSPGNDQDDVIAPGTPVEQQETYFQVKLTIKPWVVRAQDAVLG